MLLKVETSAPRKARSGKPTGIRLRHNEVKINRYTLGCSVSYVSGVYLLIFTSLWRSLIPVGLPDLAFLGAEVSTFNNILTHGLQAELPPSPYLRLPELSLLSLKALPRALLLLKRVLVVVSPL
jgi:hypothetical protein